MLFNLAMESVSSALQHAAPEFVYRLCGRHFSLVAYADDLALLETGEPQLSALLAIAGWVAGYRLALN